MNKPPITDSRITAWALGELDEPEASAVAHLVQTDPEAKRMAERARITGMQLADEFAAEHQPGLGQVEHLAIESRLAELSRSEEGQGHEHPGPSDRGPGPYPHRSGWRRPRTGTLIAGAAAAAIMLLATGAMLTVLWQQLATPRGQTALLGGEDEGGTPAIIPPAQPEHPAPSHSQQSTIRPELPAQRLPEPGATDAPTPAMVDADLRERAWRIAPLREAERSAATEDRADGDSPTFRPVAEQPHARIGLEPGSASFAATRRALARGEVPRPEHIQPEQWLAAFDYEHPVGGEDHTLAGKVEIGPCPWNDHHHLARVHLAAPPLEPPDGPIDLVVMVSLEASMDHPDRLAAARDGLARLALRLDERDRLTILTFAERPGIVLPPTRGDRQRPIQEGIEAMARGGKREADPTLSKAVSMLDQAADRRPVVVIISDSAAPSRGGDATIPPVHILNPGLSDTGSDTPIDRLAAATGATIEKTESREQMRRGLHAAAGFNVEPAAVLDEAKVHFNPHHIGAYRLIGYERADRHVEAPATRPVTLYRGEAVTALFELVPKGPATSALSGLGHLSETIQPPHAQPDTSSWPWPEGDFLAVEASYRDVMEREDGAGPPASLSLAAAPAADPADLSADHHFAAGLAGIAAGLGRWPQTGPTDWDHLHKLLSAGGVEDCPHRAIVLDLATRARAIRPAGRDAQ